MPYETRFLAALVMTVSIETVVLIAMVRYLYRIPAATLSLKRCVAAGIIASALTLPYLWFVLPAYFNSFRLAVGLGEVGIVLVEVFVYTAILQLPVARCLGISLCANGASVLFGLLSLPPFHTG